MTLSSAPRRSRGVRPAVLATVLAVLAAPLALGVAAPAQADVTTKIAAFPHAQDWSNAGLITVANDWSGVAGVQGYRGDSLVAAAGADPQTVVADGAATPTNVIANNTGALGTNSSGGIIEHEPSQAIALQGSGTADVPHLVFHLDLTGKPSPTFSFKVRDLDGSADNATQRIAVQYRLATTGNYTNLPDGYVADATDAGAATKVTDVSVALPPEAAGAADVFVRVLTADATGSDEWVGIDDISITAVPLPLAATDPGDKAVYVNKSMASFTLRATGGEQPYTWAATGLPADVTLDPNGLVSGTPTATGTYPVTATVTDGASATAQTQFDITVSELPVLPLKTIPEIQGTGAASPLVGQDVSVQGVVTARYPDGGINGYVIQTPGYDPQGDATPGASDGLFVYFGSSAGYPIPQVGEHVSIISGRVSEAFGITEITVTNGDFVETRAADPEEAVIPGTVIPGTDCVQGACLEGAALDTLREEHESEAYLPAGANTVTDSYSGGIGSSAMRGEFKLALRSAQPLYVPLELARPTQTAELADIAAFNTAHGVVLDDGSTLTYSGTTAYPWLTLTNTVRGGANATFVKPAILDYRFNTWRLQPSERIPAGNDGSSWVSFEQDRPAAPDDVLGAEGNLKIATFNMLNYFVHPVDEWVTTGGDAAPGTNRTCSTYKDRAGVPLTANTCTWRDPRTNPPSTLPDIGPRGAATQVSLGRQEVKEVAAINAIDADVMSLEEVENPVKLGYSDRDAALKRLVDALNADYDAANPGEDPGVLGKRWAFVPTPRPEAQPTIPEQDAIRNAFIYNPRAVETVGVSQILVNAPAMRNAREPLAQAFKHTDGTRDDAFIVITNHFKSKGAPDDPSTIAGTDNEDIGNGAGSYNGDRVRQAKALDAFAKSVSEDKGIPAVFMTGDYNAYSAEDPITTLEGLGWNPLDAENGETSYFFGGLAGSLDHVFANDAALDLVQGTTIWPINANEPIYYEYSRFNYNVTPLYDETAFRSSDHNPEIIGIKAPISAAPDAVDTVQVLASNDFHGRLLDDPASASAGAAAMAGAVNDLRAENGNTVFAMAGDIVGASTFESFIQNDKPTLDAMNQAGLEVSAAGNHEFDQGYDDLMNRIMSVYDATDNPEGGANWPYIAANVRVGSAAGEYALESNRTDGNFANSNGATWWKDFPTLNGGAGISVGFVGAVTEDLDSLVAPSAIEGLAITSIVDEVNTAAAVLKAGGCGGEPCDLVIELVHEGAPSPSCSTIKTDTTSTFGKIVHGASDNVDAIVSGHTHLKYNCQVDVVGEPIARPVVSAGQYGSYLNQLEFDFAPGTADLVGIRQHVLAMKDFDEDAATKAIVADAVDVAAIEGAEELGQVAGAFKRARRIDEQGATVENRGGESTLGNQVAEMQRWKTGAQIGVMNPGGLRDDLLGTGDSSGPVTYREAANVQPFANTLITTELTGAQVKLLLEQQWQRDPDGNIPSRPFLRLGTSKGFTFTEDSSRPEGDRITGMRLDGVAIDPAATYTVAANSFVASGGDNFRAFTLGANTQDTGFTDLQATVEYLAEFAGTTPLPVDYAQHGVGARVGVGPFSAGDSVTIPVDSLSMTGAGDVVDTTVAVSYGGVDLDTRAVTTTLPSQPFDTAGTTEVSFTMPVTPAGTAWFKLTGTSGTVAWLPVLATDSRAVSTVTAPTTSVAYGQPASLVATVTPGTATGAVLLKEGTNTISTGQLGAGGTTTFTLAARSLAVGQHTLTLEYAGDGTNRPSSSTVDVTVTKAATTTTATATPASVVQDSGTSAIAVAVTASGFVPTGSVSAWQGGTELATATLVDGQATLTVGPFATTGDKAIEVRYAGDGTATASTAVVTVTVTATPAPQPSATTVSGTSTPITYGAAGSVTITVAPAAATGQVELVNGATSLGTATLAGGTATIGVPAKALEVGTHTLVVRYLGSSTHTASQNTVPVTVTKAEPTVKVKDDKAKAGKKTKLVAKVSATGYDVTGEVKFVARLIGGKKQVNAKATLKHGKATVRVVLPKRGKYKLVATYTGDEHTLEGEDKATLTAR